MPTMYKLVTQERTSHNGMRWEIGKTNRATEEGNTMCTAQVLHCYSDPLLAVFFNPIHASIHNPILLEIECSEIVNTDGCKYACKEQTPTREIPLPQLTTTQRVAFAIKCSLLVYGDQKYKDWANDWLSGKDRSSKAAYAAAYAAYDAADAAYAAAAYAAYAAAYAAYDAADAAYAAAAYAAARAAYAARAAADEKPPFAEIMKEVISAY